MTNLRDYIHDLIEFCVELDRQYQDGEINITELKEIKKETEDEYIRIIIDRLIG